MFFSISKQGYLCYSGNMVHFEKKVLDNGLRVIVAPMVNSEAATLLVLANIGSRFETKNISGISHFLEHLFFKGTKSRPKPGQALKDLDKIGATHNAFTSKETTGFWVKSSAKDFDVGLDIVSDILLEPLFKPEEIEKEKGVILQEINMYEDEPRRKVWDILENVLFGDQPIGWDVIGTKESVSKIKRDDIVRYKEANYFSKNMLIVAAGNLEVKETFSKIAKYFGKVKKGKNKPCQKVKIFQNSPRLKITEKKTDQTHLALAVMAYDMFDEKRYILNLLSVILGGNSSSRLFREIREKLGLAYGIYAFPDYATDCGYLGIGAGISHSELERVVKKIIEILKSIKEKGVSKEELKSAKNFIRGQTALKLETSDDIATFCASQELFYNKVLQPEEILKKIEKVSQSDIIKTSREVFRSDKINSAVISQYKEGKEREFRKLFSKL